MSSSTSSKSDTSAIKRKCTGDESSDLSSNVSNSTPDSKRVKTSERETETLQDTGIFFASNFISLDELIQRLERVKKVKIPDCVKMFATLTKDKITCSLTDIDWSKDIESAFATEIEAIDTVNKNIKKLLSIELDSTQLKTIEDGQLAKILFSRWQTYAFDFLAEIKEILKKLVKLNSIEVTQNEPLVRESIFTQLFLKFTEIVFLKPEIGEKKKKTLKIRNKIVGCVPDVRFYVYERWHLLMMLFEVKRSALTTGADEDLATSWIEGRLKPIVLEQIGAELVSESCISTFCPNILGIVCMRTEIIFLYLEMNNEQYKALMKNEEVKETIFIQYTKSYDIMKKDDRDQLIDIFIRLACVQDFIRIFTENVKIS